MHEFSASTVLLRTQIASAGAKRFIFGKSSVEAICRRAVAARVRQGSMKLDLVAASTETGRSAGNVPGRRMQEPSGSRPLPTHLSAHIVS